MADSGLERGVAVDGARDFGGGDEIRFERLGAAGVVTLTRPKALNALTHGMVLALERALDAWHQDDGVELVVVRAEGRAFCAGGDIVAVYRGGKAGRPPVEFFADEYRLNTKIRAYGKPYVSLIDGIVMGGGFGISCHGSHRVVTENASFAMPECGIGFFPDVGGSFVLPRLHGAFGIYLALTGSRIRRGDLCRSGLATATADAASLPAILDALVRGEDVDATIAACSADAAPETDESTLHAIGRHFSLGSMRDIVSSLRAAEDTSEFAAGTLAALRTKSPTSLLVTFEQMEAGGMLSMEECMTMEFRILNRMLAGHDFYEGVRAALIDKDHAARWRPASLGEVGEDAVAAYFAPLPGGELRL